MSTAENSLNRDSPAIIPKTVRKPNPFSAEHSGYGQFVDGVFRSVYAPGSDMEQFHREAHDDVRSYVLGERLTENGRGFHVFSAKPPLGRCNMHFLRTKTSQSRKQQLAYCMTS